MVNMISLDTYWIKDFLNDNIYFLLINLELILEILVS